MDENLHDKLARLQWLTHKRQLRGRLESGPMANASRGQGRILAALKLKDGISTRELAYLLGLHVSSLNELLAKMEKAECIIREPSEGDRRVMLVKLTDKGRSQKQPSSECGGEIFGCLNDEEQKLFGQYLDRISDALEAELGSGPDFAGTQEGRERLRELAQAFGARGRGRFGGWE